jgi:hypothetical protein
VRSSAFVVATIAACGPSHATSRPTGPTGPTGPQRQELVELVDLMKAIVDPPFSRINFVVYHADEAGSDPAKLRAQLLESVATLERGAGQLVSWPNPPVHTPAERQLFSRLAAELDGRVHELERAAMSGNAAHIQRAVEQITETCNACHEKFRHSL